MLYILGIPGLVMGKALSVSLYLLVYLFIYVFALLLQNESEEDVRKRKIFTFLINEFIYLYALFFQKKSESEDTCKGFIII